MALQSLSRLKGKVLDFSAPTHTHTHTHTLHSLALRAPNSSIIGQSWSRGLLLWVHLQPEAENQKLVPCRLQVKAQRLNRYPKDSWEEVEKAFKPLGHGFCLLADL